MGVAIIDDAEIIENKYIADEKLGRNL